MKTILFDTHQSAGARIIDFGGWDMPVQYSGILNEHRAVRGAAGLFDISHMGEVIVTGPGAARFLNRTLTNDARKLRPGLGQYTILCNQQGGAIDDLYLYQTAPEEFLLVINAARIDADVAWLRGRLAQDEDRSQVALEDQSAALGAVALQGPAVRSFIDACVAGSPLPSALRKNEIAVAQFQDAAVRVACTGYSGEDGFEIIAPTAVIPDLWRRILAQGAAAGVKPCGLGARDTLRTEMGYPLYGHELDETISPIEAGLAPFVALDKGEFCGRAVLAAQKASGPPRRAIAFRMSPGAAIPRPGQPLWPAPPAEEGPIGTVTSGTLSPSLNVGIGLGLVRAPHAKPGAILQIEIRGRRFPAELVRKPIYQKPV